MFACRIIIVALALAVSAVYADENADARILVTYADPGMSHSARAGPARPGYSRRSASYLVSVGVRRAADRVAKDFNLEVVDEWPIVPLNVHCLVYRVPGDAVVDTLLAKLRDRPEVESAQRLNRFDANGAARSIGTDPYANLQHTLQTLEVSGAHAWNRGAGSNVTIIDTGVDLSHPELRSQVRGQHDFVGSVGTHPSDSAHGTAIAGVIAAAAENGIGMIGIAPETRLTVLRACWLEKETSQAVCDSFTLAKALTHAMESQPDIINLSLGGPHDPLLTRLLRLALDRGIVVVAAAPKEAGFPADVPGVIVVGSHPAPNAMPTGAWLLAPGDEILVPVPGGGFDYASGTSLSAAHVSGVIALLVAEKPGLDRDDVTALLAHSQSGPQAPVNACRALAQLTGRTGCAEGAAAKNVN